MSINIKLENFETIYRKTYNRTLKFIIIKCSNMDDINDILQDTYIELLNKLKKNKKLKIDNLYSYILGIANNILKRYYHKKSNNVIQYSFDNEDSKNNLEIKDESDFEQDFITKENVKEVWEYIKNKDLEIAKIFYLYFSFGLKISEISNELNLKESNVKNKIYRTLNELNTKFKQGGENCD